MKTKTEVDGYILRSSAGVVFVSCVIVALSSAINLPHHPSKSSAQQNNTASPTRRNRILTFADRVAYQRAIEEVYWQHRIWPESNAGPKPSVDKVMSHAQIEKKVEDYLRDSQALADYWQRPITPDQLQAEMERMASHTRQPGVLREMFAVLDNDPLVIAECLARPVLAERLLSELYAHDQRFHGELKRRAEADLRTHTTVSEMKETRGLYTEVEWVKSDPTDADPASVDTNDSQALKMNVSQWQDSVKRLAKDFGNKEGLDDSLQIKAGVLSPLQEDDGDYYAVAVMKKGKDRLKVATVAWLKEPLRSWVARAEAQIPVTMAAVSSNYTLPTISSDSLNNPTGDTWTPTSTTGAPSGRWYHTAIWTGTEMIVWGGRDEHNAWNTGGRYNPSTDSWTGTGTANAPAARFQHTASWTGTEMIVWGGHDRSGYFNTGGRYNPSTDTWTATSTSFAPAARAESTAAWTGIEMIIWGGRDSSSRFNSGGRYNPSTDSWTATSTSFAPAARYNHTAVWTGKEMIVWGGGDFQNSVNTGGRYNPRNDAWSGIITANAPAARYLHTAVWTGSEMIVWGGYNHGTALNSGGRFNPNTRSWTATNTTGAPSARGAHTAVWAGSQMIVWGGDDSGYVFNSGGGYIADSDSWTPTSATNAPTVRFSHTAVWTGSEMIIWGGDDFTALNTGGRYIPCVGNCSDRWTATSTINAPANREVHTAVWTGSEMIVWGGSYHYGYLDTGGRYNPITDSWTATSTISAPSARDHHTAVWTGTEMVVWGGAGIGSGVNTGGRYNPITDSWAATSTTGAPDGRSYHTAVWTGSEMIVWGGISGSSHLKTGGRYNPGTDSWIATDTINAPAGRNLHTAVWTGSEMIVWGGTDGISYLNTGARYNPIANFWTATSTTNVPAERDYHTAVWTGSEMIIWGGFSDCCGGLLNIGGRYDPRTDSWTFTSTTNAPDGRFRHTAVWTGSEMIVWGGTSFSYLVTGGVYDPRTDSWIATSTDGPPDGRLDYTAVWTSGEMVIWGGYNPNLGDLNSGGRYAP